MRAAEFLCDLCLREVFRLSWISGESNPADIFTKALPYEAFVRHRATLMNLAHGK